MITILNDICHDLCPSVSKVLAAFFEENLPEVQHYEEIKSQVETCSVLSDKNAIKFLKPFLASEGFAAKNALRKQIMKIIIVTSHDPSKQHKAEEVVLNPSLKELKMFICVVTDNQMLPSSLRNSGLIVAFHGEANIENGPNAQEEEKKIAAPKKMEAVNMNYLLH